MPITEISKTLARTAGGVAMLARHQGTVLLRRAQSLRSTPKEGMDDQTIKAKVESELFRAPGVEKGDLNVTVVDGRVILHGTAKNPAAVQAIRAAVSAVPEVKGVENRLALKKSAARKAPSKPARPRRTGQRVNREVKTTKAEPSPKEHASAKTGRAPAPFGAKDAGNGSDGGDTPGSKVEAALQSQSASPAAAKTGTGAGSSNGGGNG